MKTDAITLARQVQRMRMWQKEFFRLPGRVSESEAKKHAYEQAKEAEQVVDRMLADILNPQESLL